MYASIDPGPLPILVFCIVANVALLVGLRIADRRAQADDPAAALPPGAQAALLSVTEVLPDPRNHLAIKDPTSELRLTDEDRRAAAQAGAIDLRDRPAARAAAEREALRRAGRTSRSVAKAS